MDALSGTTSQPTLGSLAAALKAQYRLDEALPDSELVDEERARLAGPDRDAMRSVVAALCEELVRVKDSLDLFVRSDRSKVVELDGLLGPLKQIADTLAVLGFGQRAKESPQLMRGPLGGVTIAKGSNQ